MDPPGQNTGVGCHFFLQGIFLIQGLNLGLLHYRQILYRLSHQGSPHITHIYVCVCVCVCVCVYIYETPSIKIMNTPTTLKHRLVHFDNLSSHSSGGA